MEMTTTTNEEEMTPTTTNSPLSTIYYLTTPYLFKTIRQNIQQHIHKYSIQSILNGICDTLHEEKYSFVVDIYNELMTTPHDSSDILDYNYKHYTLGILLGVNFMDEVKSDVYDFNEYELLTNCLYGMGLYSCCHTYTYNDTHYCRIDNIIKVLKTIMIDFNYPTSLPLSTSHFTDRNNIPTSFIEKYERLGMCESQKLIQRLNEYPTEP